MVVIAKGGCAKGCSLMEQPFARGSGGSGGSFEGGGRRSSGSDDGGWKGRRIRAESFRSGDAWQACSGKRRGCPGCGHEKARGTSVRRARVWRGVQEVSPVRSCGRGRGSSKYPKVRRGPAGAIRQSLRSHRGGRSARRISPRLRRVHHTMTARHAAYGDR